MKAWTTEGDEWQGEIAPGQWDFASGRNRVEREVTMKGIFATVLVFGFLAGLGFGLGRIQAATGGDAVFQSLKCAICHKADRKGAGPSLQDISGAYADKRDNLINYLKGEETPLIDLGKPAVMKGALKKIEALSDEDLQALADYLLSFKK
jgi:cytochrome c551/c552